MFRLPLICAHPSSRPIDSSLAFVKGPYLYCQSINEFHNVVRVFSWFLFSRREHFGYIEIVAAIHKAPPFCIERAVPLANAGPTTHDASLV
jgi:hypothetical protein